MSVKPCRVLVVDDDADTREALTTALSEAGFSVEGVDGGGQALEWIRRHGEPDVILIDLRMPHMDGDQLLARLRGGRARAIVLSGDSTARLMSFARDAKFLGKPVDLHELEKAVSEACAA
jgi:two-component system, NtrC family, nitrogen regulation response regulator GlnG